MFMLAQKKIDRWANTRKQTTKSATERHEQNKKALRKFNDTWRIFRTLPFTDTQTTQDQAENETREQNRTHGEQEDKEMEEKDETEQESKTQTTNETTNETDGKTTRTNAQDNNKDARTDNQHTQEKETYSR